MSIFLNSNIADLTPVVINTYPCFFFFCSPAYRFQIAGYRDVHEYRDVKQKEPVSDYKYIFPYH